MEPLISIKGISKNYPNQDIPALDSVDLTVYPGEFLAITGASGSGKSTLLNILGLLTLPSSGSYRLKGKEVSALKEKERDKLRAGYFSFIFQSSHVLGYERVQKNAMLGLSTQHKSLTERQEASDFWLEKTGLSQLKDFYGKDLSGGERQRLAIARALATGPTILLADEPTGNLDTGNAQKIFQHLQEAREQGATVILITHDTQLAAQADRQITLSDGKILSDTGPLGGLFSGPVPRNGEKEESKASKTNFLLDDICQALNYISLLPFKALTLVFAFTLGIGGLVLAQGISQSASYQVSQTLALAAQDEVKVVVSPSQELAQDPQALAKVQEKIRKVQGVEIVSSARSLPTKDYQPRLLPYLESSVQDISLLAVDSSYFSYQAAEVSNPQALWQLDSRYRVAYLGRDVAKSLGIGDPDLGRAIIWLGGVPVTVLGFVEDQGRDFEAGKTIYLASSYDTSQQAGEALKETTLLVRTQPGYPAPLAEALPYLIDPLSPQNVQVGTVGDLRKVQEAVSADLGQLISGISWLLLFLATLMSATTLYTSVQSRRSEIALRRALGASRASIVRIFLSEGICLGLAGGLAGSSLGIVGLVAICLQLGWVPLIFPGWLLLGLLLGAVTGMIAAVYPALLAARAQPAEAIRS